MERDGTVERAVFFKTENPAFRINSGKDLALDYVISGKDCVFSPFKWAIRFHIIGAIDTEISGACMTKEVRKVMHFKPFL